MIRIVFTVASLVSLAVFTGCASLSPYQAAIASIPSSDFISIGDQKIHIQQRGAGPPLLLLHGFAASTYSFEKVIPEFSERFRVIAIDLNGFGYTERPQNLSAYTFENQLNTVHQTIQALNIENYSIVGHSYGGALALAMASRYPQEVNRLVLVSPATEFAEPAWFLKTSPGKAVGYLAVRTLVSSPGLFRKAFSSAYYDPDRTFPIQASEEYRKRLSIKGLRHAYKGYAQAMTQEGDLPTFQTSHPTLLIAGQHDQIVSIKSVLELDAALPNSTLKILPNVGHSALEEAPNEVVDLALDFLTD